MVNADSAGNALNRFCNIQLCRVGYLIGKAATKNRKTVEYRVSERLPNHVSEPLVRYLSDQLKMRRFNIAWKSYYVMQISWD